MWSLPAHYCELDSQGLVSAALSFCVFTSGNADNIPESSLASLRPLLPNPITVFGSPFQIWRPASLRHHVCARAQDIFPTSFPVSCLSCSLQIFSTELPEMIFLNRLPQVMALSKILLHPLTKTACWSLMVSVFPFPASSLATCQACLQP